MATNIRARVSRRHQYPGLRVSRSPISGAAGQPATNIRAWGSASHQYSGMVFSDHTDPGQHESTHPDPGHPFSKPPICGTHPFLETMRETKVKVLKCSERALQGIVLLSSIFAGIVHLLGCMCIFSQFSEFRIFRIQKVSDLLL